MAVRQGAPPACEVKNATAERQLPLKIRNKGLGEESAPLNS